ncbi:hypothetical protein [Legionella shakespearei]|nr:hypothetical protein [Legionella shakespearei]
MHEITHVKLGYVILSKAKDPLSVFSLPYRMANLKDTVFAEIDDLKE